MHLREPPPVEHDVGRPPPGALPEAEREARFARIFDELSDEILAAIEVEVGRKPPLAVERDSEGDLDGTVEHDPEDSVISRWCWRREVPGGAVELPDPGLFVELVSHGKQAGPARRVGHDRVPGARRKRLRSAAEPDSRGATSPSSQRRSTSSGFGCRNVRSKWSRSANEPSGASASWRSQSSGSGATRSVPFATTASTGGRKGQEKEYEGDRCSFDGLAEACGQAPLRHLAPRQLDVRRSGTRFRHDPSQPPT